MYMLLLCQAYPSFKDQRFGVLKMSSVKPKQILPQFTQENQTSTTRPAKACG